MDSRVGEGVRRREVDMEDGGLLNVETEAMEMETNRGKIVKMDLVDMGRSDDEAKGAEQQGRSRETQVITRWYGARSTRENKKPNEENDGEKSYMPRNMWEYNLGRRC